MGSITYNYSTENFSTLESGASTPGSSSLLRQGSMNADIVFDNTSDPDSTLLVVGTGNRKGLLFDIVSALRSLNISVVDASLTSHGERVLDVFKVQQNGGKIPEGMWDDVREKMGESIVTPEETADSEKSRIVKQVGRVREIVGGPTQADEGLLGMFTRLLETVVRQHDGQEVVDAANRLTMGFKELQSSSKKAAQIKHHAELLRFAQNMEPKLLMKVVRMLNLSSALLNTAEEYAKNIARREQVKTLELGETDKLWQGSFHDAFKAFKEKGVTHQEMQELLNSLTYSPVFTAHPTEARRPEVNKSLGRIFHLLFKLRDSLLGPLQIRRVESEIEGEVEILWRTDEMRTKKPTVLDEIVQGLEYYNYTLFEATIQTYRSAEERLAQVFCSAGKEIDTRPADKLRELGLHMPSCIQYGSWIGGDRDGNPFVKPKTTEAASMLQSRVILAEYIRRLRSASERLTHSTELQPIDNSLHAFGEKIGLKRFIENIPGLDPASPETYKLHLRVMQHRLEQNLRLVNRELRTNEEVLADPSSNAVLVNILYNIDEIPGLDPEADAYKSEDEFIEGLRVIRDALLREHSDRLVDNVIADLLRLAETFGFYLAKLDVRQESTRHEAAVAELLGKEFLGLCENYSELDNMQRLDLLVKTVATEPPSQAQLEVMLACMSPPTLETVQVLQAIAKVKDAISPKAIGAYCISMAQTADDVLEVLFLGWFVNRKLLYLEANGCWTCNMYVSPLFETIPDLKNMPIALKALLENTTYMELVRQNNNTQEVMLGYSDSCKDGGTFASQFGLYEAQKVIKQMQDETGVHFRVFHGRGGSIGRGAGPGHESIMSLPPGSVAGETKFTEQGEVITYRYGTTETAVYELGCGITALMKASHPSTRAIERDNEEFVNICRELAQMGEDAYRELTDNTTGFYDYFYETTVVNEIALMNMGSRPARRVSGNRTKASLRAIPWVFAWAQSRHTVPGWYGVGTALQTWSGNDPSRIITLQRMHDEWPFFHNFISAIQMGIFKSNMTIAKEYARLCTDGLTEQLVYNLINNEHAITHSMVLMTTQSSKLLAAEYAELRASLRTRESFLNPLNYIQVILLARSRDQKLSDNDRTFAQHTLLRTIKAVASSIRNTG